MIDSIEGYTIFINNNVTCTYYPLTKNTSLHNLYTGEYIVLNLEEWSEVAKFLEAIAKR